SRFHAEVFLQNGLWMIRDAGGRNPTKVNGEKISSPAVLKNGSVITIGKTILRFTQESESKTPLPPFSPPGGTPRHPRIHDSRLLDETALQQDELAALLQFMGSDTQETYSTPLIRSALEIIHRQTCASATGFLNLDPEDPLRRMVLPQLDSVDVQLSRQLTQSVQRQGKAVWLAAEPDADIESESLKTYADAICIPLQAGETPVGALHVYKTSVFFTEREVRFCEIVSRHLANSLHILRFRRSLD